MCDYCVRLGQFRTILRFLLITVLFVSKLQRRREGLVRSWLCQPSSYIGVYIWLECVLGFGIYGDNVTVDWVLCLKWHIYYTRVGSAVITKYTLHLIIVRQGLDKKPITALHLPLSANDILTTLLLFSSEERRRLHLCVFKYAKLFVHRKSGRNGSESLENFTKITADFHDVFLKIRLKAEPVFF